MERTPKKSASYNLMKQSVLDSIKKTLKNLSFDMEKTISDLEGAWTYSDGLGEEVIVPSDQILKEIGMEIPRYQITLLKVMLQISNQWLEKMK